MQVQVRIGEVIKVTLDARVEEVGADSSGPFVRVKFTNKQQSDIWHDVKLNLSTIVKRQEATSGRDQPCGA